MILASQNPGGPPKGRGKVTERKNLYAQTNYNFLKFLRRIFLVCKTKKRKKLQLG